MTLRLSVAAALLVVALCAPPAHAGQIVFRHGDAIWLMNDDGSGARQLVAPADAQSQVLREPAIVRDGSTIYFAAETDRFKRTFTDPETELFADHFGRWATGIWRWQGGRVSRLSPAPSACENCTGRDQDPGAGEDGRVAFDFELCTGAIPTACSRELRQFAPDAESSSELGQACGKDDYDAARAVVPNPARPAQFAYVGCADEDGFERIWTAGARREGERPIARLVTDDTRPALAWRPDGGLLAARAGGPPTDAGLYVLAPDGGGMRRVIEEPPGVLFNSPAFMGNDRIVFGATSEEGPSNLYVVRADCRDCRFPDGARQLTRDNVSGEPAWTAAGTVAPKAGERNPLVRVRVVKGRKAPRRGFALRITLRRAARVGIRLRRAKRRPGTVTRSLRRGTSTVRVRKVGRRRLARKRRYKVTVAVAGFPGRSVRARAR